MKSRLPPSKPPGTTPQSGDTWHVTHLRPKPPPWHRTPRKIPTGLLGRKSCYGTAGTRSRLGGRRGPALLPRWPAATSGSCAAPPAPPPALRAPGARGRPRPRPVAASRRRLPVSGPAAAGAAPRRRAPQEARGAPGRRRRRGDAAHLLALTWLAAVHVARPPLRVLGAAMLAARPRPDRAPAAPRRVPAPEAPPTT